MALTSSALMKSMRVKFTNQPIFTILLLAQILILVNSILRRKQNSILRTILVYCTVVPRD